MPGEHDFIGWLKTQQRTHQLIRLGIGDDLAVLDWKGGEMLIGADQVLDRIHFDSEIHPPTAIGRKAMNRNLSDCAAMACLPAAAIATVALPRGVGLAYAQELYNGLSEASAPWDCPVVGGDTASWAGPLALSVTILGRPEGIQPITRSGGKPGDTIHVTGPLGGSLLGRHMTIAPRVAVARSLAQKYEIHSMIDISDGLSRDLANICRQSGVGAVVNAQAIPIHPDAITAASDQRSPLEHAMHDGEDYELLFSTAAQSVDGAVAIGRLTAEPGIWLEANGRRTALEPLAWEHSL